MVRELGKIEQVDIRTVWEAMFNDVAPKTQFYFVDACRIKPELFQKYTNTPAGVTLDVIDAGAAESSTIFYSAATRSFAL